MENLIQNILNTHEQTHAHNLGIHFLSSAQRCTSSYNEAKHGTSLKNSSRNLSSKKKQSFLHHFSHNIMTLLIKPSTTKNITLVICNEHMFYL